MRTIDINFPDYDGSVKIKRIPNSRRFELLESFGIDNEKLTKITQLSKKDPTKVDQKQIMELFGLKMSNLSNLFDAVKKFVASVELKRKSDGEEFKSWDDLDYDAKCLTVQMQIMTTVISGGISLGKSTTN